MMKNLIIPFFTILFLTSCISDDNDGSADCSFNNGIETIDWVKSKIEESKKTDFYQYEYILSSKMNNRTVFIFANCCPTCNSVYEVFDCSGRLLGHVGDENIPQSVFSSGKVVWKSENNKCKL